MRQIILISHSEGMAHLQDKINKWFAKADLEDIEIHKIFIPSAGVIAIVYEVKDSEKIEEIRRRFNVK